LQKDEKEQALKKQNADYNNEYKQFFNDTLTKGNGKAQNSVADNSGSSQTNGRNPRNKHIS
jgi:hypothetical protein